MLPVSDLYLETRGGWRAETYTATHYDPFTKASTPLPIRDGTVTVDGSASCRRTLSLTLPPLPDLADTLAAPGGEVTVTQTTRYIDHSTETIPIGVFVVDGDRLSYDPDNGQLSITGRDRSVMIQRNKFGPTAASSIPTHAAWQEIERLVEGAWPNPAYPFPGWAQLDTSATTPVGPMLYPDRDRDAAIRKIATANSVQVYFAPDGRAVLRKIPVPKPGAAPVWTVRPGEGGALFTAERVRDRSRLFNVVIVDTSTTGLYLPQVVVSNTDRADPYSIYGPLGYQPKYVSSPAFYQPTQMQIAAIVKLSKLLGTAAEVSLSSSPNAALEVGDVIGVRLPRLYSGRTDRPAEQPVELRVIDSLTVPLHPSGVQQITCRSVLLTGYEALMAELEI